MPTFEETLHQYLDGFLDNIPDDVCTGRYLATNLMPIINAEIVSTVIEAMRKDEEGFTPTSQVRGLVAEAWDEGHDAGRMLERNGDASYHNPYRINNESTN